MTIMFAVFEGGPMISRFYGCAKVIHRTDAAWPELRALFDVMPGTRQIFDLSVDLVEVLCGMAVPFYDYAEGREQLKNFAEKKARQVSANTGEIKINLVSMESQ